MQISRTVFDDAITLIASSERPREDFWFSYKLVRDGSRQLGLYNAEIKAELFAIRDSVLVNNDVATATYRLAKLADRLSKFLQERGYDNHN